MVLFNRHSPIRTGLINTAAIKLLIDTLTPRTVHDHKMKLFISIFFAILFIAGDLFAIDLATTLGKNYKDVEIVRLPERGLLIMHESGAGVIPYPELPGDLQKKYQYHVVQFNASQAAKATRKVQATTQTVPASIPPSGNFRTQTTVRQKEVIGRPHPQRKFITRVVAITGSLPEDRFSI